MKNWFFWSSEIKYSLMLSLYFKLKLQKIRERRIYTLLSAGLNLSHMHVTHIHVTYLLLFNLHFYSSRYLSNIHIAQNRHSFTRLSVIQYNKRFLNLFEFIWTFEFSSTFFYHSHFFLFVIGSRFVSIITPYGKYPLQNTAIKFVSYQSYRKNIAVQMILSIWRIFHRVLQFCNIK